MRGPFTRRLPCLVAAVTIAACVPATADKSNPRGAVGARLVATPIARGASFVTTDGWTVGFDRIAVVALVATFSKAGTGGARFVVWDGAHENETYVPSLPAGQVLVRVDPEGFYRDPEHPGETGDPEIRKSIDGSTLAPEVRALVLAAPDNALAMIANYSAYGPLDQGPATLFAAHATKDGRTYRIALALASAYSGSLESSQTLNGFQGIDVQANEVRYAAFELHPERIFAATSDDPAVLFGPFAAADADGDGVITGAELRAIALPGAVLDAADAAVDPEDPSTFIEPPIAPACIANGDFDTFACFTLLDRIADNAQHVIVPATTPP